MGKSFTGKGLIGKKAGMTQVFLGESVVPVTVIEIGPCPVLQVRTKDKDGYNAIQLGFGSVKHKVRDKTDKTKYKVVLKPAIIKEFRVDDPSKFNKGDILDVSYLEGVKFVDVSGYSKGRGFQGVMKRWGFSGAPDSHGQSVFHRRPGSIGQHTFPAKVWKGKKMAGRMGGTKVTVQNLEVVYIDKEKNLMLVKGSIPGYNGSFVIVREAIKKSLAVK
ncbi:MAG: 50S ribosomal protein L3 [Brevinematales bacterium]|nr:50S ribosomal protein L3 [Brevinematales bacterium]